MSVRVPLKFRGQPPLVVRIVLLVPLTLFFWVGMVAMGAAVPFVILFGRWEYKK